MIDKVKLNTKVDIDEDILNASGWKRGTDEKHNCTYYDRWENDIYFKYIMDRQTLTVIGRFINASEAPNKVHNLDVLYEGMVLEKLSAIPLTDEERYEYTYYKDNNGGWTRGLVVDHGSHCYRSSYFLYDLDNVLNDINALLYRLTDVTMDIRDFRPVKVEVCFNLETSHVEEYLQIMNLVFKDKDSPRHVNYALEKDCELTSSFYVKTKGEFAKNSRQNYTVNFYNKFDELSHKPARVIKPLDLRLATGILRMEVQVNYSYMKSFYKKKDMDHTERRFADFLDVDFCASIIKDKYRYFIDKDEYLDFYSYQAAKEKVEHSDLSLVVRNNLLEFMRKRSRNNNKSSNTKKRYNQMLSKMGIHWFFIPTNMGIDYLPSPMKLLDDRVANIKHLRDEYYQNPDPCGSWTNHRLFYIVKN